MDFLNSPFYSTTCPPRELWFPRLHQWTTPPSVPPRPQGTAPLGQLIARISELTNIMTLSRVFPWSPLLPRALPEPSEHFAVINVSQSTRGRYPHPAHSRAVARFPKNLRGNASEETCPLGRAAHRPRTPSPASCSSGVEEKKRLKGTRK